MSGSMSVAVTGGGGGGGYWAPFTAVQWQELEHQALIYKYLVAGVPVPTDLVLPIRRSLEALSARLLHHPASVGYCSSYYGKKFDPEPGRCRRTDGKKWRCAKEAFQESKYCEKHMNRGRNRSRKPVESQSTSHSSLSTDVTGSGKRSYQNVSSSRSSSPSLYSITKSGSYDFGSDGSKLQMDGIPYAINSKDLRYAQGPSVNVDNQNYTSGVASNLSGVAMMPTSQAVTNSLSDPQNDSYLLLQTNSNTFGIDHEHQLSLLPWSKPEETWSHHHHHHDAIATHLNGSSPV